jgi:hypothetical protein
VSQVAIMFSPLVLPRRVPSLHHDKLAHGPARIQQAF